MDVSQDDGRTPSRRIVHVVNALDVGGAERLVVALATLQTHAGHRVLVHCLFERGSLAPDLERIGVAVSAGDGSRLGRIRSLAAVFRRFAPDVVHCHNRAPTVLGAPLARMRGVGCVISTRHGVARFDGRPVQEAKYWLAARACSHVVSVSDATSRMLAQGPFASRSRLITILNGAPAPAVPQLLKPPGELALVSVARLAWPKDHATLLRAVASARASVPGLQLYLVGDGPERLALQRLCESLGIAGIVRFLGEQQDVGLWLAHGDVFVLSSLAEGAPLALIEALSAGLIPIATAVGGVPEILALSGVGRTVPAGDHVALAESIVATARQRDRWPEWQRQARDAYARHFTMARMADQYEALMRTALAPAKAGRVA